MVTKRADGYAEVHKGIRRELSKWVETLGNLDGSNADDVAQTRTAFSTIELILQTHAAVEEAHFHPLLSACNTTLVTELEREHELCELLLKEAVEAFDLLCAGGTDDNPAWQLQRNLYLKFSKFTGHYFVHLDNEETVAGPLMWDNYTDGEIIELIMKVRGAMPPEKMATFLSMIIPAVNIDERVAMFSAMKENAPQPAFESACALASSVLSDDDWQAVCTRVGI